MTPFSLIIQNGSIPCCCAPVHRRFQNMIRTSVTHSAMVTFSWATFSSYRISTSSAISYWTDAQQHGIYLLIWDRCFGSVLIMRAFAKLFRDPEHDSLSKHFSDHYTKSCDIFSVAVGCLSILCCLNWSLAYKKIITILLPIAFVRFQTIYHQ